MQLSIRPLDDVQSVNSLESATQLSVSKGDPVTLYFQLIDAVRHKCGVSECPATRYMPAAGAALSLVLDSIDDAKKVTKTASQPFAQDPSIWKIDLQALDTAKLSGTISVAFTLTEGSLVRTGRILAAVLVA